MLARRCLTRALGLVALVVVVGCSKGNGQFATVSGTITHNGAPVDGARVEFHGTTESEGKRDVFSTTTDSSGKYMIAGVGKNPGIPPGLYKVVVTKTDMKGGNPNFGKDGFDAGQMEAAGMAGQTGFINLLPKEYATVGSTKLSVTVDAGKNENKDFDLKEPKGK